MLLVVSGPSVVGERTKRLDLLGDRREHALRNLGLTKNAAGDRARDGNVSVEVLVVEEDSPVRALMELANLRGELRSIELARSPRAEVKLERREMSAQLSIVRHTHEST